MSRQSLAARTGDRIAVSLAYGVIGLGLAFLAIPLVITCLMAFDARTYLGPLPPPALSLHWFERLVSQADILTSLRTSLILAVLTTVLSVTIGTAAAVGLARGNFPGKAALTSAFLSPLIVPPVVIGFGLLLFLSKAGITNGMARLLLGHVIVTLPYCIRTSLASLLGSDQRLTEAAMVLGATERQAFWTTTLPLMRTGVVTGAIFAFAISIDDVSISLFLSDPSATTLPVTLVSNMRAAFDLTIAAAAVVLIAVTALLIVVLDRVVGFDTVVGQGLFRS
ncbi:ABC transporter permease [Rhizobium leguminosarum]|uniref:ABC transporter permease subunit n=1 Tax=Rhizobium leguminosarum TaxID=384 RepID=A0A6P0DI36_RHILE|nr:ABC transporter permease [Rhizobium leguminosarum]ASS55379.1 ABC transporter permease [Rhizobium leguminosarum bv. viciae]AVC51820.1 binding-protein-dependent transport system inner membrane component family protein [Rhizobium leguminosarum bv. viciae]MBB4328421.1 putative spermidine/putrescine transport system permease protein [Rhizobium leguminosarum]MBB4342250.1 putative spermidine/putrescine transport system permease protein [Rhizobium leguminosarum]MBB4354042.1 putative spermidine/putr